jgi:hypothetical protein
MVSRLRGLFQRFHQQSKVATVQFGGDRPHAEVTAAAHSVVRSPPPIRLCGQVTAAKHSVVRSPPPCTLRSDHCRHAPSSPGHRRDALSGQINSSHTFCDQVTAASTARPIFRSSMTILRGLVPSGFYRRRFFLRPSGGPTSALFHAFLFGGYLRGH